MERSGRVPPHSLDSGRRGRPRQRATMQRDLVLRATTGDRDAFATLAKSAYGRLHRTAQLILRREDLASDAVQEALTSAWLHIGAVRDADRFDAWLNRLVVRACYQELRRANRGPIQIQ